MLRGAGKLSSMVGAWWRTLCKFHCPMDRRHQPKVDAEAAPSNPSPARKNPQSSLPLFFPSLFISSQILQKTNGAQKKGIYIGREERKGARGGGGAPCAPHGIPQPRRYNVQENTSRTQFVRKHNYLCRLACRRWNATTEGTFYPKRQQSPVYSEIYY